MLFREGVGVHHHRKRFVHIVEEDFKQCEFLAARYPEAVVTNADIADEGFLEQEDLSAFDLMVNMTGSSELNIIAGVYGKSRGVDRILAVVSKNNYRSICQNLNVDVVVSQKNAVVNSLVKLIRKGDVRNIYALEDSEIEIIELAVGEKAKITQAPLKDLNLPHDLLVLFITRDGQAFIPSGSDSILSNDVVAFVSDKKGLKTLDRLVASTR